MNNNNINHLGQFQFKQLIEINQDALSANFQLIHDLLAKLQNQQEDIIIQQEKQLTINSQLNNQMTDLQLTCKKTDKEIDSENLISQFDTLLNRFNVIESLYINIPHQKEKKKYITSDNLDQKIKELNQSINDSLDQNCSQLKSLIQGNDNEIKQVNYQMSKQFQLLIDNQENWKSDIITQTQKQQANLSQEYSSYFDQFQKDFNLEIEKQQHQINSVQNQIRQLCVNHEKEIKGYSDLLQAKQRQRIIKPSASNQNEYTLDQGEILDLISDKIDVFEKQLAHLKQENNLFHQQITNLQSNQQQLCSEEEVKLIISKDISQFSNKFYEKLNQLQFEIKNNPVVQDQEDIETKIGNQCNKFVDNLVKLMANKEETKKALIYLDEQIKYLEIKWDQFENQSIGAFLKQQEKCISCDKQIKKISGWGIFPPKLQISERLKNSQSRNDQQERKKRMTTSRNEISQSKCTLLNNLAIGNVKDQTSQRGRVSHSQENLPNLLIKQLMNTTTFQ